MILAKVISKNKNKLSALIMALSLTGGIALYNVSVNYAATSTLLETWHPYKNFLCTKVPHEILGEDTPIGLKLGEVQNIIKTTYIKGEKPLYIDGILVVNKEFSLPSTFDDTTDQALEAKKYLNDLKEAALGDSIYLNPFSGYRSYQRQQVLYSNYVARDGQEAADRYSAKPGNSEHQTGLAFDIGGTDSSKYASTRFNNTIEANWLKNNAYKFGFVLRFLEGKEDKTGYMHESWHYRYVGKKHSAILQQNGLSIEEYLGLDNLEKINQYFQPKEM